MQQDKVIMLVPTHPELMDQLIQYQVLTRMSLVNSIIIQVTREPYLDAVIMLAHYKVTPWERGIQLAAPLLPQWVLGT